MEWKTRKRMFFIFVGLFFIIVPVVVLFTQGYRVNLDELELVKTGGIDLDIKTLDTRVYLDNELSVETNFFFRNAVFRNIIPGTYNVRAEKEGHKTWEKNIEVKERRVSKYLFVRLFPEKAQTSTLARNVRNVFMAPDKKHALITTSDTLSSQEGAQQTLQLNLLSIEDDITSQPVITLKAGERVEEVKWSTNAEVFYININSERRNLIYTGSVNNPQSLTNWSDFINFSYGIALEENNKIIPTSSQDSLYVMRKTQEGTFSLDKIEEEPQIIMPNLIQNVAAFEFAHGNIYYQDNEGGLNMFISEENQTRELSNAADMPDPENTRKIIPRIDDKAALVLNNNELFLWREEEPLQKISKDVLEARFGNKKIMYWQQNQVVVYWLEEVFGPPKRNPGDKEVINEFNNITKVDWLFEGANQLGILTDKNVVFTEIDSRGGRYYKKYTRNPQEYLFSSNSEQDAVFYISPENHLMRIDATI